MLLVESVTRWKCILCGTTHIPRDDAIACARRCKEEHDDDRPISDDPGFPATYPADEPRVDPFDCMEDHFRVLAGVVIAAPMADGMIAVYAGQKLIAALREERGAVLDLCKRMQRNVKPVEIDPLVRNAFLTQAMINKSLATPSDGKKGRAI